MTADGSVVVGRSGIEVTKGNVSTNGSRAFRWTPNGGMQNLGTLPGHRFSEATAVSDDGTIVIGNSSGDAADSARAFHWTGVVLVEGYVVP